MKPSDILKALHEDPDITWDGDNREVVQHILIPNLALSDDDKATMQWAYAEGYELRSDGETAVPDRFMRHGGKYLRLSPRKPKLKSPAGVTHDAVNRVPDHRTPDGQQWTIPQANGLYRRVMKALNKVDPGSYYWLVRYRRWLGVTTYRGWWR